LKPADQPGAVPFGGEGYDTLPVVRATTGDGQQALVTAWELEPGEVDEVIRTGRIWLTVLGRGQPPVLLSTECPYMTERQTDDARG
jgi:hypothetical protein